MTQKPVACREELRAIARRAMLERGLKPDFSPAARAELGAITGPATRASDVSNLEDRMWCSIDNTSSRDLDQLTFAEELAGGVTRLFVAIADVDALVEREDAIDAHARANTTSVYTPAQVFPMLPERLSTDLTSLGQDAVRLAVVVEIDVGADGRVGASRVYRASVRNRAKLAYGAVAEWLEGRAPMPGAMAMVPGLDANLRLQDAAAQRLRALRHEKGALELQTLEPRAVFDGDWLTDLLPDDKNRAKELIEDCMVAANGVTARFLQARGFPSLRRELRSPDRWMRIVQLAEDAGDRLPTEPSAVALAEFLARRRRADPDHFPDLSLSVVKLLGRGEYVLHRRSDAVSGHFGLAVRDYTHSTAPNRRFPDLVTQRLIKAALAGDRPPYGDGELDVLARHCTLQEDNAAKVERRVTKSAAALLLANQIGERFDAIVTGASPKGTWVRVFHPSVEGRLVRGFEDVDVGDRVKVELAATDVERGFIDFVRVHEAR